VVGVSGMVKSLDGSPSVGGDGNRPVFSASRRDTTIHLLVASLRDAITFWYGSFCYRALHPLRDAEKAGRLPSLPTDCATFDFLEWTHIS